jgi:uncharacterized protein HemX
MDALDRAAALEDCAVRWKLDAQRYRGRRKQWRLERADHLMKLAWSLID